MDVALVHGSTLAISTQLRVVAGSSDASAAVELKKSYFNGAAKGHAIPSQ